MKTKLIQKHAKELVDLLQNVIDVNKESFIKGFTILYRPEYRFIEEDGIELDLLEVIKEVEKDINKRIFSIKNDLLGDKIYVVPMFRRPNEPIVMKFEDDGAKFII